VPPSEIPHLFLLKRNRWLKIKREVGKPPGPRIRVPSLSARLGHLNYAGRVDLAPIPWDVPETSAFEVETQFQGFTGLNPKVTPLVKWKRKREEK